MKYKFKKQFKLLLGLIWVLCLPVYAGYFDDKPYPILTDDIFTADEFIMNQAKFWFAIYVEVGDDEGFIHDPFYPDMVFQKIKSPGTGRAASKAVEARVNLKRQEIRTMLAKDSATWTPEERILKACFPSFWDSTAIILCVDRLRFQRGLKGKFQAGLERSYRYLPMIESTLTTQGVPPRLKYLPHVESSFYPFAYSKVGAAGMWQFMKSSALHYGVSVGYLIDDRRDPEASTLAAARMLAYNFSRLKSWPLAIVAYNHGPGGLANAVRGTGTSDLGTIIKSYYSNTFGFASKNFYAEFLAASSIAMRADSIYPQLKKMQPLRSQGIVLGKAFGIRLLSSVTGLAPDELEEYNLRLRPATFRGNSQLPKGFLLRLPDTMNLSLVTTKLGIGQPLALAQARAASKANDPVVIAMAEAPKANLPQDKVDNLDQEEKPLEMRPPKPKGKDKGRRIKEPKIAAAASESVGVTQKIPKAIPDTTPKLVAKPVETPVPKLAREVHILDTTLTLAASDMDKLANPMDRFNPSIYNLEYKFEKGILNLKVGTDENLSHYAEWAGVSENTLKRVNAIKSSRDLAIGRRIKIPLSEAKAAEFVKRREDSYRAIEEDFYSSYYVSNLDPLIVEKGMNLWKWAQEREIPFWLLQKHNIGKSLNAIHPGDTLSLPVVESGVRKWGFTRYGNSQEYLAGISRFLRTGLPEAY